MQGRQVNAGPTGPTSPTSLTGPTFENEKDYAAGPWDPGTLGP